VKTAQQLMKSVDNLTDTIRHQLTVPKQPKSCRNDSTKPISLFVLPNTKYWGSALSREETIVMTHRHYILKPYALAKRDKYAPARLRQDEEFKSNARH
jgi:hypothetical protein